MTDVFVQTYLTSKKGYFAQKDLFLVKHALEQIPESAQENLLTLKLKRPLLSILLSIFLSGLGLDRFYLGDKLLGVGKIFLTVISLYLAYLNVMHVYDYGTDLLSLEIAINLISLCFLVDLFLCYFKAKRLNLQIITEFANAVSSGKNLAN